MALLSTNSALADIAAKVEAGERLTFDEIVCLE